MDVLLDAAQELAIQRMLSAQKGAIARWQLRWAGLSNGTASRVITQMPWVTVHPGIFIQAGATDSLEARAWAAVLSMGRRDLERAVDLDPATAADVAVAHAGEEAVVTGWAAAALRGLTPVMPSVMSVLLDRPSHRSREGIQVIRGAIDEDHWTREDGLLVASGPRLVWDLAWAERGDPRARHLLRHVAIAADANRLMAVEELCGLVEEPSAHDLPQRVPRLLREVAEDLRPGFSHSATEAAAREVVTSVARAHGLYVEPCPHAIWLDGRIVAEADIAVPEIRHDFEIDGPHHAHPAQRRRDERRDGRAGRARWTVSRHVAQLVHHRLEEFRGRADQIIRAKLQRAA